jgi:CobQ-like glutamine amidotransferase family enzyme
MELKLAYFYPTLMNLYGDRGNVQTLMQRCRWRGISLSVTEIGIGDHNSLIGFDLAFFGGGQDKEQYKIGADLIETKGENLKEAITDGIVMLAVCGGYQLLGEYYRPLQGPLLHGISILDARTEGGTWRAIGNVIMDANLDTGTGLTLVGFENHSGRTYLGTGCRPLGKIMRGFGNNGQDKTEGCRFQNCFGTYLHGPILPKNPLLADYLIGLAMTRKFGTAELEPLDDKLENQARENVIRQIKKQNRFGSGSRS